MKKRLGRIVSLCLTVALMTTNIGYLPPINAQPFTGISRKIIEDTDSRATPSTATRLEATKATPSEATPSNANKTVVFVKMDPDDNDIPEYYSKVTKAGKKFWKFEDRYGAVQYRDYGFIKGEAEFPLWYEADQTGTVEIQSIINEDEEFYDLAPYIWTSVEPNEENWNELYEQQYCGIKDKRLLQFENWDETKYGIWHVIVTDNRIEHKEDNVEIENSECNGEESDQLRCYDLYFIYGYAKNVHTQDDPKWLKSDSNGHVMMSWRSSYQNIMSKMVLNDESLIPIKFRRFNLNQANTLQEFYDEKVIYAGIWPANNDDSSAMKLWNSEANLEKVQFPVLENYGDIFLGWTRDNEQAEPTYLSINSDKEYLGYVPQIFRNTYPFSQFFAVGSDSSPISQGNTTPGFPLIPGGTEVEARFFMGPHNYSATDRVYKGVWIPGDKPSLILINGFKDYYGGFGFRQKENDFFKYSTTIAEKVEMVESISVAQNFGDKFNDLKLRKPGLSDLGIPKALTFLYEGYGVSNSSTKYYDSRRLVGYFSKLDGMGQKLDSNYEFNKVGDKYYAYFVPKTQNFKVEFQDDSGNIIRKDQVVPGRAISTPPVAPDKSGYTFNGWVDASGSNSTLNQVLRDTIFKPSYHKDKTYKQHIVYQDWNGDILKTQEVAIGEAATPPIDPTRTGYTFTGWDKSFSDIQEDTVITAQYTINSHRLILDGNGGKIDGNLSTDQILTYGQAFDQVITDGAAEANRKYYSFDGWYTAPTGGSKYSESGNKMPDTDLTIYAHWKRSSSEVTFKDWNGSALDTQEVSIGADATSPEIPDRPGYTFTGWDKPLTNIQDHTDITAQYSINGYLLTLDGNGGTLEENSTKEVVVSFDQSFDQILVDGKDQVKRTGYHFDGWYTSALGGSSYSYSGNQMPSIDVNVFAHWSPNTYKITFDPNHKKWVGGEFKEEHTFDTELGTLPAPEIYGWKFDGWWTGKNGSGTKITEYSMEAPKDVVYYGNWKPVIYKVSFVSKAQQPEGESVQIFPVNQAYDEVFHTLPEPEEKGYTFTGWYDGDNKKINPQTIFQPDSGAEGYTYHAGWKANHYKIRFVFNDTDGTPVVTEMNQEYPSRFGTLPTPEKSGYMFVGWFKENGDEVTTGSWIEAGDKEYKARWRANQYTIHFDRNLPESETVENPQDKTVTYALPVGVLPHLNETGYLFLGWFTELDGGSQVKETTLAALGDQTYYGHWVIGIIDNGNGTYRRPGADGKWNTVDDELWWKGLDGISQNSDDKQILTFSNGISTYADNGNGTHYRTDSENWISGIEHWWNGTDGILGTDDDIRIYNGGNGSSGTPIYYIDSGNGMYIRPGASGNWASGTEYWWYGADGKPGTTDDRQIYGLPGGSGYYIDNGNGTYTRSGTGGSWENGTEYWWYGADGKPGTADDKQIHIIPGGSGYYIDNGDGTYTRSGTGGSWGTNEDEIWNSGPDGKPGTADDRQIYELPGGSGSYIDNEDGTYTRPGTDGSWGTDEDEIWNSGPDGIPGTADDYKQIETEPTNPEPSNPEPTDPEPTKPEPTKPEPTKPEPTKPEPTKPEPTDPEPPKLEPIKESEGSESEIVTSPMETIIDSKEKPTVPDEGGSFTVNPKDPYDVTYKKPDGSIASNEWVGDGEDWYHVDSRGKLNYDWYLDGQKTWYKLNKETGDKFGAALVGWNHETMDDKKYFFDPKTTQMLTGWQCIDYKWYYFTKQNEAQTYYGTNDSGWKYEPMMPGKPYGSMYQNEKTPDGYRVDENGVWIRK